MAHGSIDHLCARNGFRSCLPLHSSFNDMGSQSTGNLFEPGSGIANRSRLKPHHGPLDRAIAIAYNMVLAHV